MTRVAVLAALVAGLALVACAPAEQESPAPPAAESVQERLDALQRELPDVAGFAIWLRSDDGSVSTGATGVADPTGRRMSNDTPVRLASITKTLVAATVLRLWEQDKIDLDAPIGQLISAPHIALLQTDGYETDRITVRHLLMHAGGLADHAQTPAFLDKVVSRPDHIWTRAEQVQLLVDATEPLSAPGESYSYSDTGYILLGEIIETITKRPLAEAVRQQARLEEIGLADVLWEGTQGADRPTPQRAHQWYGDIDTFVFNGSLDSFGGGGLIASAEQTGRFFAALFDGDVFDRESTLTLMTEAPGHPDDSPYRIGLFEFEVGDAPAFGHSGFWGTDVFVIPSRGVVVSGVSLNNEGFRSLRALELELVSSLPATPN
ncbi:MAG: serine hydrolase domain-containing protein [Pseudomonadota bacterium]